jgi:hypothetical protein
MMPAQANPGADPRHDPAVLIATFTRLGQLFLDFKGSPLVCALFYTVKLAIRAVKGGVVGAFYGGRLMQHRTHLKEQQLQHCTCPRLVSVADDLQRSFALQIIAHALQHM